MPYKHRNCPKSNGQPLFYFKVNKEDKRYGLMYELIDYDNIDISRYMIDESVFGTKGPHIIGDSEVTIRF